MSSNTFQDGFVEAEEIVLAKNTTTLSVPASTQEKEVIVPHNLGITPFFDYKISPDGGVTYYPPANLPTFEGNPSTTIQCYTDETDLHIVYTYRDSPPPASSRSFLIDWKLYVTESTR